MSNKETSTKPSSQPKASEGDLSMYELLTQREKDRFKIPYGIATWRKAPFLSFFVSLLILGGTGYYVKDDIYDVSPKLAGAIGSAIVSVIVILHLGFKVTEVPQFIICKKKILTLPVSDDGYSGAKTHEIKYEKIAYVDWITIRMSSKEPVSFLDPLHMADIHYATHQGGITDRYKQKIVIVTKDLDTHEIDETQCGVYNAFAILFELFNEKEVQVFRKYR